MEAIHLQVSEYLTRNRSELAKAIVDEQYRLQPEFWIKYGAVGYSKSLRDEEYHLAYLTEALAAADPSLFLEYLQWCKVFFTSLGFPEDKIRVTFECMRDVLPLHLPAEMSPMVADYLCVGLAHLAQAPSSIPSFLPDDSPLAELAHQYIQALLRGERAEANSLILNAVQQGTAVRDIYLHVFQPSQFEIGRLWQTNKISVAQEHFCTAATQMIMSQLYPYIFTTEKKGRQLVISCVGGELHEIGARMVADFFEMDGWDTYYLGANTPSDSIIRTITERDADLLAISATITPHVHYVSELIKQVHSALGNRVKIMVGGYPFNVMPALWQQVGADGFARDAPQAIVAGNKLLETALS